MAVTQISKIQVRRGKKSQNGVPQLSSGEFGWVVDAQELYIGNGSVAEGAPLVGNTKILTEHTNILELVSSYQFGTYDVSSPITQSVSRPLGSKIDEIQVSVKDFGAVGDGQADDTAAFQAAVDNLFDTPFEDYRKVLVVPNGIYVLSNLALPSGTIIQGETRNGSVLYISNHTIDLSSKQNILIENITIQTTTGIIDITELSDSKFESVLITGEYSLHQGPSTDNMIVANGLPPHQLEFLDCGFVNLGNAIYIDQQTGSQSTVTFRSCNFFNVHRAIHVEGSSSVINRYRVSDCQFVEVYSNAVLTADVADCVIQHCEFKNVGSDNSLVGVVPLVDFGNQSANNLVVNCISTRRSQFVPTESDQYVTEVKHSASTTLLDRTLIDIEPTNSRLVALALSGENQWTTINYHLTLGDVSRHGTLSITPAFDQNHVAITDHYQYSSETANSNKGKILTEFEFFAEFRRSAPGDSQRLADTVLITYKNPFSTQGDSVIPNVGTLSYDVSYGV